MPCHCRRNIVHRSLATCILNISTIILTVLCMYITAPPVNYSILCISSIVPIVAFVNLLLKKMVVVVVHPALSCAVTSIFLQLYLYPAVHICFSRSLFQGRPLPLWPCGVHCSTCLVMLSSFFLNVCPGQFHFLLRICSPNPLCSTPMF